MSNKCWPDCLYDQIHGFVSRL